MRVDLDNSAIERVALDARRETLTDNILELGIRCQANAPVLSGELRDKHDIEGPDAEAREARVISRAGHTLPVHEGHRIVAWGNDTGRFQPPNPWMTRSIDEMSAENGG